MTTATKLLDSYEPQRRPFEIGFWLIFYLVNAAANSMTAAQDFERQNLDIPPWEAVTWECSSAIAALLLISPIVWLTNRFPLGWRNWKPVLLTHLLASTAYTLAHVMLMVGARKVVYVLMDGNYDFGDWASELAYEYLKDARSYLSIVLIIEGYRFVLLRLRGEARWPDPPDREIDSYGAFPERFLVKMLGREFLVPADKIESVSAAGNYVNLRVGDKEYPLRSTMKNLMSHLDPELFQRVHRSHAVRIDALAEIQSGEHGDATLFLKNGQTLPCSKSYRNDLNYRTQYTT